MLTSGQYKMRCVLPSHSLDVSQLCEVCMCQKGCPKLRMVISICCGPQERLRQQKEEAQSNPEYGTTFKDQLTKDEKKARRKQILANIGETAFVPLLVLLHLSSSQHAYGRSCHSRATSRAVKAANPKGVDAVMYLMQPRQIVLCSKGLSLINTALSADRTTFDTPFKCSLKMLLVRAGEDLLVASADKPFRFPATFTFVVRSFTVLDGIGKGLDPRFDISEIAAPYARSLILEAKPQFAKLQQDFGRRLQTQVRPPSTGL